MNKTSKYEPGRSQQQETTLGPVYWVHGLPNKVFSECKKMFLRLNCFIWFICLLSCYLPVFIGQSQPLKKRFLWQICHIYLGQCCLWSPRPRYLNLSLPTAYGSPSWIEMCFCAIITNIQQIHSYKRLYCNHIFQMSCWLVQ